MIKLIEDPLLQKKFNETALHPLQSWEWGEARKKMGIKILRIGEFSKSLLKNVFQLTLHSIPYTRFKIGYLPRSVWPSKQVIDFLYDYGKSNNIIFIKIEPYVLKKNHKLQTINYELSKSPHPLFPEWTQIIDLTESEEELLKKMHHKTRYNIKLAQKKGVIVRKMSDSKGFEIFSKLYFETCKRQKYYGHTPEYHKIVWNRLKNNIAHILIAFYDETPIAAYELFYFKDVLYYPYGGTSTEYRNVMAPNLLMWEAIKLGRKLGANYFDMWGSLPPQYDYVHDWAGFTRFKEGYGGEFVQFVGNYDLVIDSLVYRVYNLLYKLRRIYLSLKKVI